MNQSINHPINDQSIDQPFNPINAHLLKPTIVKTKNKQTSQISNQSVNVLINQSIHNLIKQSIN